MSPVLGVFMGQLLLAIRYTVTIWLDLFATTYQYLLVRTAPSFLVRFE